MEIGIDSFAAKDSSKPDTNKNSQIAISELLERIAFADKSGLDFFGIGEHHRKEFLDSAPTMILAAAAAKTEKIILSSAVTVLSAADPVKSFSEFCDFRFNLKWQGRNGGGSWIFHGCFSSFWAKFASLRRAIC